MLTRLLRNALVLLMLVSARPNLEDRWAAVHAMRATDNNVAEAHKLFKKMVPGCKVKKFSKFAKRWRLRADAGGMVFIKDPRGRKPKVAPELVETIATEWTQAGVGKGSRWRPYRSMAEVRGLGVMGGGRHVSIGSGASATLQPPAV